VHPRGRIAADVIDRAVAELYRAHYRSLVRIAALLISDTAAAEGIVQAAFLSLHRAKPHLEGEDKALAYLRRRVVSGTRSRGTAPARPPGRPGGTPHASVAGNGIQESLVMAALYALPARQREALVLRYYGEWPDAQIAAAMGISSRALVSHIARGMSALRACRMLD
jgi:DNA-directed RNA polymerase specialized sigma24 family protein